MATCHPTERSKSYGRCRSCYRKDLYKANPQKHRQMAKNSRLRNKVAIKRQRQHAHRVKTYGITLAEFEAASAARNNLCDICHLDRGRTLHIDHCHKTGVNRGLLCNSCNRALGWYDHHWEAVDKYLEEAKDIK